MPVAGRGTAVEHGDDDILFEFDHEDPNASTGDPFDASEFDNEGGELLLPLVPRCLGSWIRPYDLTFDYLWSIDSSRDEGISIPRSRTTPKSDYDSGLAKSLPMRVPTLTNYRTQDIDIEDDRVSPRFSSLYYFVINIQSSDEMSLIINNDQ